MNKPNFKMTKFHYRGIAEAEALQKAMFELGFCWPYKASGVQREFNSFIPTNGFLYVNEACRIMYTGEPYGLSSSSSEFAATFAVTLFAAANAHKAEKRAERKASRKRAAVRRQAAASTAAGWIDWNSGKGFRYEHGTPSWSGYLPRGTLVDIKFRDGTVHKRIEAGVDSHASGAFWHTEGSPRDIVAYRLVKEAKAPNVEADGFIPWDGTGYKANNEEFKPGNMSGPVLHGTMVDIKFRDGGVELNIPAGTLKGCAAGAYWQNDGSKKDIVAYRLAAVTAPVKSEPVHFVVPEGVKSVSVTISKPDTNRPEADADGFIAWDGTGYVCGGYDAPVHGPVGKGTLVDVKYRNGEVRRGLTVGNPGGASGAYWRKDGMRFDIVAYRVVPTFVEVASVTSVPDTNPEREGSVSAVGDVNSDARGSGARFNAGKPDFSLIPMKLLEGEARVWAYGARKYKAWNWMKGMDWNVPFACAMRHMAAWQAGEDIDPETGESHLDHAMCNLRMLRYYADFYKEGDNRPKQFFNVQAEE